MAIAPNVTFVSGAILTAAQQNAFGFGVVALTTNTTALQSGITTATDLTGMTATWTAIASRNYRITYYIYALSTVANDCFQLNLVMTAPSTVTKQTSLNNAGAAGVGTTCTGVFVGTFAAGSTTVKLQGLRGSGTGTFTFNAAATLPWILCVEDIGPA